MGISKYEMSAMEYLQRYGKDGKRLARRRKVGGWIWFGVNISLIIGIVLMIVKIIR
jgi:hypothetical protein